LFGFYRTEPWSLLRFRLAIRYTPGTEFSMCDRQTILVPLLINDVTGLCYIYHIYLMASGLLAVVFNESPHRSVQRIVY
jgi:hypothetical protein